MALRANMFKTPKHRKFAYRPRYFDPKKEEFQERIKQAELMAENTPEGAKARIANKFRRRTDTKAYQAQRRRQMVRSNMLLVGILILLTFGAFYIADVYMDNILQFLG